MRKERFGKHLKQWRESCNLSQKELAARVSVHPTYISKIENGKVEIMPSYDLLKRLEKELFLDCDAILDYAGYYDPVKLDKIIETYPDIAREIRRLYEQASA